MVEVELAFNTLYGLYLEYGMHMIFSYCFVFFIVS